MRKGSIIFLILIILLGGVKFVQAVSCDPCDVSAECGAGEVCIGGDPGTPSVKEGVCQNPDNVVFCSPITHTTFGGLIDAIVDFIFNIAVILVPLMVIIGAFYLLTAAGDPKKIATGKTVITSTLIGLAIILLAKGLIAIIEDVLGIKIGG